MNKEKTLAGGWRGVGVGAGGCVQEGRGKQMRGEPEQNFIHEFVRRRLKTTAP